MSSKYRKEFENNFNAGLSGGRSRWSLSLVKGRKNDSIEWQSSERQRRQEEEEQRYQLQQEQRRQHWVRKALSKRAFRLGFCIVATTFSFLTFAQPSPWIFNLEDFQRRVRVLNVGGDSTNDIDNAEPFSESLLFGEAEVQMEPSIVRICREINDALLPYSNAAGKSKRQLKKQPEEQQEKRRNSEIQIVQETVHVCTSQSLFESMLTMYHSTMMLQTLNELGIDDIVKYNHDCHRFSTIQNGDAGNDNGVHVLKRTVQMEAHPNLLREKWIDFYGNQNIQRPNSRDELVNHCTALLQYYASEQTSTTTLSPILTYEPEMTVQDMSVLMEFMLHNAHYAAMNAPADDPLVLHLADGPSKRRLLANPAYDASSQHGEDNVLHYAAMNAAASDPQLFPFAGEGDTGDEFSAGAFSGRRLFANNVTNAPSHDGEDTVFIYIDSRNTRGFPLHFYTEHIPRSATNVIILTSPNLHTAPVMTRGIDKAHVDYLHGYITDLMPRAKVEVVVGDEIGSLTVVKTLLGAGTLICPPGLDCWIPAVLRGHGAWAEHYGQFDNRKRTVVVDTNEGEYDGKTLVKLSHLQFTRHIMTLPSGITEKLAIEKNRSLLPSSITFLQTPPTDRAVCPAVRGRHGTWTKDEKYAARLQYKVPIDHMFGFADQHYTPVKGEPYRAPTMYRWLEDKSLETCPIHLVTLDTFCATMADLNVGRLFFVGDFVGMNQAYSLWKLLGNLDSPKPMTEREPSWIREVVCPEDGKTIQIQYTRNDVMEENKKKVDLPLGITNCKGHLYCYRWTDKYMDYYQQPQQEKIEVRRTILITSFGPHFYEEELFRSTMADFLKVIKVDLKDRLTKDLIFYRTIAPGHELCNRLANQDIFKNFDEYRATITGFYSWDMHDGFNDIADRMVREFNDAHYNDKHVGQSPLGHEEALLAPVHILDVYPMTVLRRDGHIGGNDCHGCMMRQDCFHYSLPGPSDWWNHLLFSNLEDLAVVEKRVGHQQQK